jgi:fructokinase
LRIVSLGEILWDVMGDHEFLGGAPLNFSICLQRLGDHVALVSAVGDDRRGVLALKSIRVQGIATKFIRIIRGQPTGTAVAAMDNSGSATFTIERPAAYDFVDMGEFSQKQLSDMRPEWIYFGTLAQTSAGNESVLRRIVAGAPAARCFYDMNLREGQWSPPLVERLSTLATILKLNESEAEILFGISGLSGTFSLGRFCEHWSRTYNLEIICITLGERGCAVWSGGALRIFPGVPVRVVDTVGAGDAFSAAFLHGFELGWPLERTAGFANALGALVASRAGATPAWTLEELL